MSQSVEDIHFHWSYSCHSVREKERDGKKKLFVSEQFRVPVIMKMKSENGNNVLLLSRRRCCYTLTFPLLG